MDFGNHITPKNNGGLPYADRQRLEQIKEQEREEYIRRKKIMNGYDEDTTETEVGPFRLKRASKAHTLWLIEMIDSEATLPKALQGQWTERSVALEAIKRYDDQLLNDNKTGETA